MATLGDTKWNDSCEECGNWSCDCECEKEPEDAE
jgi:hypothetical protein